jgi:hypothetical protein
MDRSQTHAAPSVQVVNAIADARGVDPLDLDPLWGRLDLDAVDDLFTNSTGAVRVEWSTEEVRVTVEPDGRVEISGVTNGHQLPDGQSTDE